MRFYRLEFIMEMDGSQGFRWFTNKADAERVARKWFEPDHKYKLTTHEIEPTKTGILKALNSVASHPNNG